MNVIPPDTLPQLEARNGVRNSVEKLTIQIRNAQERREAARLRIVDLVMRLDKFDAEIAALQQVLQVHTVAMEMMS